MTIRKGGLGKGLDALFPTEFVSEPGESIIMLPVSSIKPNPQQPRHQQDEQSLQELAESIQQYGILQPLIVSCEPGEKNYFLIAGERRLRAARMANLANVPVIIRLASDQERLELALIENIQRSDLTPLDTAQAYQQLNETFGLSHEEIAKRVGKSRTAVTNNIRLLKLPKPILNALAGGQITEGHARSLLGLNSIQAQLDVLRTILAKELSVRHTEELVRKLEGKKPPSKVHALPSPEITSLEDRLRDRLGTRVKLNHSGKGGNMVIYYYSDEELDALINRILEDE
jgi:ParB family chromosome partitioning protein